MHKIQKFLKRPYYFQWLILFFVLHGYSDYTGVIKFSSLAWLTVKLSLAAWTLFFVCKRIYRDPYKAALLVTVVFFGFLFFGAIQDNAGRVGVFRPFSLFVVLIPVLLLLYLGLLAGLFFYKKPLIKITALLNLLFLVYIGYDVITTSLRTGSVNNITAPAITVTPIADTMQKPDVYLILLDEYLGSSGLKEYYNYDNSFFESFLKQKGFHICSKPSSNYSFTIYSMASLFNMRYLDLADVGTSKQYTYKRLAELIKNNPACEYFKRFHYSIHNYSSFSLSGHPAATSVPVLPTDIELITDKIAWNRLIKRIMLGEPQNWLNVSFISAGINREINNTHEKQMQSLLASAGKASPAFTYIHLLMPHKPFVFDSTGKMPDVYKEVSDNKRSGTDKLYLQYLVYTNKRVSRFIDELYQATHGKAVIMVMSDHGYRDAHSIPGKNFSFASFNAVYLPNRDYRLWYDSVSNVNQFPILFNTLFGQKIPLKKDYHHF
jgi:hypothetical protein